MLNLKQFLLFFFVILIVIYSWFSTGKIISNNSEENLNILSPTRTASHYSSLWWSGGTGAPNPFFLPRATVFWTLASLEKVGIPIFLIQAIFLSILIFTGMLSMYFLVKQGLNLNIFVATISSLFYFLNIYSLTQIWKRFLYNGMIAWSYLPLFLLFWFKWILENKFKWLFLFLISSLFFTYTFAHPAYFLTFWVPAGVLVLIRAWSFRKDPKSILGLLGYSFLAFALWCVINIWWLYPAFALSTSWTDENFPNPNMNMDILTAVSKSFPINEILLLRQSWYLGPDNDWQIFYHNPLVYLMSIYTLGISILGFIKFKNNNFRKYLTGIALIGLFVSKGSNFPLGFIFYSILFSILPFTAALRNSYEKFGLVWLLPYAIFFSYGLFWIFSKIKNKFNRILFIVLTLLLSCGLLVYPIWNGDIFPPKHRVELPTYYGDANKFLNSQKAQRIFHIPFLTEGSKMTYDWGYVGEDPTENIFDSENLSSAYIPLHNKTLKLLSSYFENKNATKIFGLLGVDYIIFQKDIIYPEIDFVKTIRQIDSWERISKVKTFGKLELYSLDSKIVRPQIYISSNIIKVNSLAEGLDKVVSYEWGESTIFTFQNTEIELKNNLIPQISYSKISPTKYRVNIQGNSNPFILVLNNTYDKFWNAKINNQIVTKHFNVNGFANGWFVDTKGDFEMEINLAIWPWN